MVKETKRYFQGMEHLHDAVIHDQSSKLGARAEDLTDQTMRKQIRHDLIWVVAILFVLFAGLTVIMVVDRNSNVVNEWSHIVTDYFIN